MSGICIKDPSRIGVIRFALKLISECHFPSQNNIAILHCVTSKYRLLLNYIVKLKIIFESTCMYTQISKDHNGCFVHILGTLMKFGFHTIKSELVFFVGSWNCTIFDP